MDKTKATFIVLSSFLALSAASAGVSTLAWFNLNRTARLSVSKVTIHKVSGSLRAHIYDINGSDSGVDVDDPSYEAGVNYPGVLLQWLKGIPADLSAEKKICYNDTG